MNSVPPPETVRGYLDALRRALKGAPPGLIADALADCEEHLNGELAQNPGLSEKDILASVVETYGSPQEIAEEYRDMEAAITTPFPKPDPVLTTRRFSFFNVISDPRTYGAMLYMLLSLVTGIFYFTWTVTGLSLTLGFAILIIGIPFALLFIGSIRVLSHVEGRIVEALLGVRMPRRLPAAFIEGDTRGFWTKVWAEIGDALADLRTWTSMLYLLLMLPLGVVYFVFAVVGLCLSVGIAGDAIYCLIVNNSNFRFDAAPVLNHLMHTAPGLILAAVLGLLLFFLMLHVFRGIGWLHGKIAEGLLVRL